MSAETLQRALADAGAPCRVEAVGALAVIIPLGTIDWRDPALLRSIGRLGPAHGFTHVAVELPDEATLSAALPRG